MGGFGSGSVTNIHGSKVIETRSHVGHSTVDLNCPEVRKSPTLKQVNQFGLVACKMCLPGLCGHYLVRATIAFNGFRKGLDFDSIEVLMKSI